MCEAIKHTACLMATIGGARALPPRHAARAVHPQSWGLPSPQWWRGSAVRSTVPYRFLYCQVQRWLASIFREWG